MKEIIIYTLIALNVLTACQLIKARNQHETCFCDSCCELHYESIRSANPSLPPIDKGEY